MTGGVPGVIVTALLLKITRILPPFPYLHNAEGQIVGVGKGGGSRRFSVRLGCRDPHSPLGRGAGAWGRRSSDWLWAPLSPSSVLCCTWVASL